MSEDEVRKRVIEDEMKESYLSYSMSVIVGRALPDVRDGLKPVHRRILYSMNNLGLTHNKAFKKSARIVGDVLGKYHPHGDLAVYDAMVRMAQSFSLRYPLVDGQGNFGSIDGDSAAAMRYTEARLKKEAEEILEDIDKETVEFQTNFDGSLKEPAYLPSKFPNLLVNGSAGIAVGMATTIPPHNLNEVCDATKLLIDNPECEIKDLMSAIKGPDFPTGGVIVGKSGIWRAFTKGKGSVTVRSKYDIEESKGKKKVVINEIPYMLNKSTLLEHIADCIKNKTIEGVSDLRDESDRDGLRIVIELKKDANEEVTVNQLFKNTRLQANFNINMLALVNNEPCVLDLKSILKHFIEHRKDIIRKRTQYELKLARDREHIVEGLITALDDIDEVIKKIKSSKDTNEASDVLQNDYSLSEKQAKAILEMRLQKLSSLEQRKLREELEELRKKISELESILNDENKILQIIKDETDEMKNNYGDERRTQIEEGELEEVEDEDLIKKENMVVTVTHEGYVKRVPLDTYKSQGRGGRGIVAAKTKDEDFLEKVFVASTHSYLLIFTNKGKVYWKKVYKIPEGSRTSRGTPFINLINKEKDERINAVIPVEEFEESKNLIFATKKGTVKKTGLKKFSRPRSNGIIALTLDEDDWLVNVTMSDGNKEVVLATKKGRAVRFNESEVRETGRTARGVRGIRIGREDELISMVLGDCNTLLTVTDKGYGKRTNVNDYRLIRRGGSGVINIKCTEKNGNVVSVKALKDGEDIILISKKGIAIRMSSDKISLVGRNTQGVRLMRLEEDDRVVAVAKCDKEEVEENSQEPENEQSQ